MVKMKPEEKIGKVKARKTVSERERHSEDEKRTSWTRTGGEKKE